MSGKFRYVFLLVLGLIAVAYSAKVRHEKHIAYLMVDSTGDANQVVKVHLFTARDSFTYKDTINDTPLVWTSPLQVRRVTVTLDTSINYVCTLDLGTNKYGFIYDPSGLDDTTVALLIDNLVDSFNNVAGMKDTALAEDSVSYVKLVSEFAMDELEGDARWIGIFGDSLTEGDSTFTTIAMVCDSMSATINANATVAAVVTAANSGDTVYTVTSDDAGLAFTIVIGDTAQDTSLSQANVASWSTHQDTIDLISLVYDGFEITGYQLVAILDSSTTVAQGLGLSDSGYLWLYTTRRIGYGSDSVEMFLLDSAVANALPLRLECHIGADTVGGAVDPDTLFKERFQLVYRLADSASDTVMQPHCSLYVDLKLIGK